MSVIKTLPSNYAFCHPTAGKHGKGEYEATAKYIMNALKKYGNTWRKLSFQEYLDHNHCTLSSFDDQEDFDDFHNRFLAVLPYTVSAEAAASYSSCWKRIYDLGYCKWEQTFHWQDRWFYTREKNEVFFHRGPDAEKVLIWEDDLISGEINITNKLKTP